MQGLIRQMTTRGWVYAKDAFAILSLAIFLAICPNGEFAQINFDRVGRTLLSAALDFGFDLSA